MLSLIAGTSNWFSVMAASAANAASHESGGLLRTCMLNVEARSSPALGSGEP